MRNWMKLSLTLGLSLSLWGCVTEVPNQKGGNRTQKAVQTRVEAGNQYLADGNRELARRQFVDVIKMDSSVAEGYLGVAQVHQANQEFEEADQNYKKALGKRSIHGKSAISHAYGSFLWDRNKYKEAAKYFEAAGKDYDYGKRPLAIYFHGRCLVELGQPEKARHQFRTPLTLVEGLVDPH